MSNRRIVELDVREMLRNKQEPFQKIMGTVSELGAEDVFELHATFRPDPLIRVLRKQGYKAAVVQLEHEHYVVQFYRTEDEFPWFHLDNRGLEPPQPMIRTLEFLDNQAACQEGTLGLEIWNERVPVFLLPELEDRGFAFTIDDSDLAEGTVRIQIRRPADGEA
ncbi:MAG: DUF2249 domain-containing protein [Alicyclobacillus herbarius]|uniref:DUF2249 domain-containing protein n=1 Tax=Alicyclobacillus herbarius TaxID=122960 RepID=UPI002357F75F|nr:DUF2249 domain-containing protein [Alicyclobacillus herbarius]MCL6633696.1 DUF2249 domain-containing protein [Alicyclobacillus herbarius]